MPILTLAQNLRQSSACFNSDFFTHFATCIHKFIHLPQLNINQAIWINNLHQIWRQTGTYWQSYSCSRLQWLDTNGHFHPQFYQLSPITHQIIIINQQLALTLAPNRHIQKKNLSTFSTRFCDTCLSNRINLSLGDYSDSKSDILSKYVITSQSKQKSPKSTTTQTSSGQNWTKQVVRSSSGTGTFRTITQKSWWKARHWASFVRGSAKLRPKRRK